MKLRNRTLLVIGCTLTALIGVLYAVARFSIQRGFSALEENDARRNLERATSALGDDLSTLERTAGDYAQWDQTYEFVQGGKPAYPTTEFPDETFPRLRINFIVILDSS